MLPAIWQAALQDAKHAAATAALPGFFNWFSLPLELR